MLSVRDHMCLSLAVAHYKYAGRRDSDIRDRTGYPPTHFWRHVNWLIDQPEAVAARPMECSRLRRLREARKAERSARRVG